MSPIPSDTWKVKWQKLPAAGANLVNDITGLMETENGGCGC